MIYGSVHYPFHLVESEFKGQFKIKAEKEELISLKDLVKEDVKRLGGKRARFLSDRTIIEGTCLGEVARIVKNDKILFYDQFGNLIDYYSR